MLYPSRDARVHQSEGEFLVCPKCGEEWEAEFVACWNCGHEAAAHVSDEQAQSADEAPTHYAARDEDTRPLLGLEFLAPTDAATWAELATIHASKRGQIGEWMLFAGLAWLFALTLATAFRGIVWLPLVTALHLIMLAGIASPYLFHIGLAVTAWLAAIHALYAAAWIFGACASAIQDSRASAMHIFVMLSGAVLLWLELKVMLSSLALRRQLTTAWQRQDSSSESEIG